MKLTDELREYVWQHATNNDELRAIADRIDEAHKHAIAYVDDRDPETMAENGWVKLPVDADGEYIRIGDAVTCGATVWTVTGLKFLGEGWGICCTIYTKNGSSGTTIYPPSDLTHHRPPTVEDVLREFADLVRKERIELATISDETLSEYAKRLRLAGEDE